MHGIPGSARKGLAARIRTGLIGAVATMMLVALCPAQAARPHYSLFKTFPEANGTTAGDPLATPDAIIMGRDGNIYGMALHGGTFGDGGIFSLTPDGRIHELAPLDLGQSGSFQLGWITINSTYGQSIGGGHPLMLLPNGDLAGVTNIAGGGSGSAFTISLANGAVSKFYAFDQPSIDVIRPSDIRPGSDGNFYGYARSATYTADNNYNIASLYSLTPDGQLTRLVHFATTYAGGPYPSNFLLDSQDNIYIYVPAGVIYPGTNNLPSQSNAIFKLAADGTPSLLATIDKTTLGVVDKLVLDAQDNVIATADGGAGGIDSGSVFKVSPQGTITTLHNFSSEPGLAQQGYTPSLVTVGSDGNIYGVTVKGGSTTDPNGTFFRITPSGTFSVLHTFGPATVEGTPFSSLIQSGPRTFSGLVFGGPSGYGAVFKLTVPIQDDVTGDGMSNLLMSGPGALTLGTSGSIGSVRSVASAYYPAAIGDLNGDGMADIVWTSPNHDLYVWFSTTSGFSSRYIGTYPAGWTVEAAADVNGDGMDDLIWLNSQTNQFAYWLMNGNTRIGWHVSTIASGYYPAAIGDFDGNGKADILWTSAKHDLYAWMGNGSTFSSSYITTYPAGWRVVGRGDLTGNGKDDLIWATNDGAKWGYWLMDGTTIARAKAYDVPAGLSGYQITGAADYNGDGRADIVWSNGSSATTWLNDDQCSTTTSCSFTSQATLALPSNETVFNSSVPSSTRNPP